MPTSLFERLFPAKVPGLPSHAARLLSRRVSTGKPQTPAARRGLGITYKGAAGNAELITVISTSHLRKAALFSAK